MNKKIKEIFKYILILVVFVASVYFVLNDIDFALFVNVLKQVQWKWCLYSLPVALLSHWVRTIRWKIFLKPILVAKSKINLFSAVMVGYVINNIIPRGGEFVRPFVYARREKVSKSAVFATIIVERVIDVLFLLLMFAVAFLASRETISAAFPWLSMEKMTYFLLMLATGILFLFLLITTNISNVLLKVLIKPLLTKKTKKYDKICEIVASFRKGFEVIKTPSEYLGTFLYSAAIWALYALPLYLMFFAFDFQNNLNLGLADAGLLVVVSGVGTSIAPTPGAIGVYHWLIITALVHLYPTIKPEEALAYATLTHGVNLILQVLVGTGFLIRENVHKLPRKEEFEAS